MGMQLGATCNFFDADQRITDHKINFDFMACFALTVLKFIIIFLIFTINHSDSGANI